MPYIQITNKPYTYLKTSTAQSASLDPLYKVLIPFGSRLPILKYEEIKDQNGVHFKCLLDGTWGERSEWFVFKGHSCIDNQPSKTTPIQIVRTSSLLDRILVGMSKNNFRIWKEPEHINIVAVRGMRPSGCLSDNLPNHFDDIIVLFHYVRGVPELIDIWVCTTEPGRYWTLNPMNTRGAARIEIPGQYTAWQAGYHMGKRDHFALVQTGGEVKVRRDLNKDFSPIGDQLYAGYFGINLHHGWNASYSNIGRTSAGCIVIPRIDLHRLFMSHICKDVRYVNSRPSGGGLGTHRFTIAFLNGKDI